MKPVILVIVYLSILLISPPVEAKSNLTSCKTKYPIVLVHGLGFRDRTGLLKYWSNIPKALEKKGALVYHGSQNAFGSIKNNSKFLKKRILSILNKTNKAKVNIIAHSKGGLESRFLISKLGMGNKVASLTTIATPHRGSFMANLILEKLPEKDIYGRIIDIYAKLLGDRNPNSLEAGLGLTIENMKRFNKEVPNIQGVYYQSYGAAIDETYPNLLWRKMYSLIHKMEGQNDGLVSTRSCKWGNFKGIVKSGGKPVVSHADIVGLNVFTGVYEFDEERFFISLVQELKKLGY